MREIKFRGKRIDNSKWVYGYLTEKAEIYGIKVDPKSVGQYLGFKDNPPGHKIKFEMYEGDIIRLYTFYDKEEPELNESTIHIIKWQGDDLDFAGFDLVPYGDWECNGISWAICDSECVGIEIIGNITDNPEVLDKSSK